jgi:catechol 2,3-dioxygenase
MADTPLRFEVRKIGHVVLNVTDLEAAVRFYTEVLGLRVSDRYPDTMVPGGMVFLRCNTDHHGVALVGGASKLDKSSLNHFAFEVGTIDEVFRARAWLRQQGVPIHFEGRRRAGCQLAVEFKDPDGNNLEKDAVANPVAGQQLPPVTDFA